MAEENNSNLFQRLTKLFRSGPSVKRKIRNHTKTSIYANSTLDLFKKSSNDVYNSTLNAYGTFDRLARYSDFSEMESEPVIASALDIYAEETCSSDIEGKSLHIHSEDKTKKEILETLFYETLDVNFNLFPWVRNCCKYGDQFLFNDVSPDFGIIGVKSIPITDIEREEGYDVNDPSAIRFRWISQGNAILENWQVTHFRLLGNDAFLPYGCSVLESARRIWRQLVLIEDAMMLYRIVRAPERRIFYVDVANVSPADVPNYMEQARASFKTDPVVNRATGQIDMRYNAMAVDEDYFIPVRGGDSGTKIDSLSGGQNTSAIEDVEYTQKKLFAALKIPKAYLGYDEDIGAKATLAQEDIRFSRTISRIQKTIIAELNKIAMIHLYCHGYQGEDLLDFNLALSNPSSMAQQQKLELISTRFDIAGKAPEGMVSKNWIYRNIFGFNTDDIEKLNKDFLKEKLAGMELEAAGTEGGGGDEGGDTGGGGDLFAGDRPEGPVLTGITPSNSLKESDFEEVEEDYDDWIDLAKVSGDGIKPSEKSLKNVWGEPMPGSGVSKSSRGKSMSSAEKGFVDFSAMLNDKRVDGGGKKKNSSMRDPGDMSWMKAVGKGVTLENRIKTLAEMISLMEMEEKEDIIIQMAPKLTLQNKTMLENLGSKLGIGKVLNESKNYENLSLEEFDLDLEGDDND